MRAFKMGSEEPVLRGRSGMVGSLAVAGDIQTLALLLFGDAQANDHVDHFVSDERYDP
jgi:hypothetical protein